MFAAFNLQQMISAFIVLFAVIDIIGSIPIIINLKEKGKEVNTEGYVDIFCVIDRLLLCRRYDVKVISCGY